MARGADLHQLERDANRFANYLVQRGLKPGEDFHDLQQLGRFRQALFGIHRAGLVGC
jgi:long-chain acyl-CoA synthetase